MDVFQRYVHEIAPLPIYDIVVQYYLATLLFFGDCDRALIMLSSPVGVPKANEAFCHEVNLTYFLFLLTNDLVILVVTPEKTGHEPKRDLINEFTIGHKLRFEETLVLIKNVREQIVSRYLLFNIYLDLFEHAIWVFASSSITGTRFTIITKGLLLRGDFVAAAAPATSYLSYPNHLSLKLLQPFNF